MDLLRGNVRRIFFKYFAAAFGSCLIMSIYTLVDTICIGQYEGPNGSAAVACFFPLWSLFFAVGLLLGIGGSVHMSHLRGAGDKAEGDRYFTIGLAASVVASAAFVAVYLLFPRQLLTLCGAQGEILELAADYAYWIGRSVPFFLLGQYLIPFIRNDGAPFHTTVAAMAGGIFNVFGDLYFVFGLDMGIAGAGLATAMGQAISFLILLAYFPRKRCTLRVTFSVSHPLRKLWNILTMGISNFAVDLSMGLLEALFNRQIMAYLGTAALAVFGAVSSLSCMVQTFGYAVGESAQAILSVNYGAGQWQRIRQTLNYAALTSVAIGLVCCLLPVCCPTLLVRIYMDATPAVLAAAPGIFRRYFLAMPLLVFNVFATYYFQAVNCPGLSLAVSLLRGIGLSGLALFLLPAVFGGAALWYAVLLAEALTGGFVLLQMRKTLHKSAPASL